MRQVQAQWFACRPDAEAAIAAYEGQGPAAAGASRALAVSHAPLWYCGRKPPHAPHRRGRPAKTDLPPTESGYRLVVEADALPHAEEDNGWTVLATTVHAERCTDAEILQAYQEQNTTVEPGFRWIKNPAAIAPWLRSERIAALAMPLCWACWSTA